MKLYPFFHFFISGNWKWQEKTKKGRFLNSDP